MTDVVVEKTLFRCFRDPVSSVTNEEGALRLLSRYPNPERVREICDREFSLLHCACKNGWYDASRQFLEKYQCDPHLGNGYTPLHCACQWKGNKEIVRFLVVDQRAL